MNPLLSETCLISAGTEKGNEQEQALFRTGISKCFEKKVRIRWNHPQSGLKNPYFVQILVDSDFGR